MQWGEFEFDRDLRVATSCLPPEVGVSLYTALRPEAEHTVSTREVLVGRECDDHVRVLEDVAAGAVAAVRVVVGG